jgi:hypothetical protein
MNWIETKTIIVLLSIKVSTEERRLRKPDFGLLIDLPTERSVDLFYNKLGLGVS